MIDKQFNQVLYLLLLFQFAILYLTLSTMDIGLSASSPSGVNFMPSSPPQRNGVQPWPEDLNNLFMDFVITQKGWLRLLTPRKRQDYRYYLNNRSATSDNVDPEARRKAAADKHWALTYFELQDNQVYRKAEQDKDGSWLKPWYAACTYDACDLICKAHENLHHAGEYITLYLQTSLY